ncbi:metalloprotease RseP [Alkalihalobacillus alcalophilus ATCC 27647 = CGMCC 1.3604]|uniref:Zinc metalloprotease n=1 Tax=Alkalihalobacillus alcalophilus ATCC 27647 = CGMCC 1.3604 TaxID=1218173 RepID=A0A094YXG9_ALKAL|nr:RIP metalloprotease RseP [Alkalihalobacillus alcalophilus]KGA98217.1 zinc metalloprotease [Alkalihalobacillus alcalophilus ATCC 27647 = CGMCC 1.3604]MED1562156.1 RIP metalloprotease RseP [Alkalihalobacillus alcalophilus]THG91381.1 metalloprotease RseP [Alkalihalobacillus alcalophilus ATCC 27647 = CGMCC 1.3604]
METLLSFILVFGLLVFIHEWGHLYFAKRAGILCREFAIGFGPKIFSFERNETVYTIRMLPLGGYVRMAGEEPETIEIKPGYDIGLVLNEQNKVKEIIINNKSKHPEATVVQVERIDLEHDLVIEAFNELEEKVTFEVDEKAKIIHDEIPTQIAPWNRQFGSKSVGKRALTIFAGPMMNFLLAFVLFSVVALMQGMPVDEARIGTLTEDGVAREAGLLKGDEVQSIDGTPVHTWTEMTSVIQANPNQEIDFVISRDGETQTIAVTPQVRESLEGEPEGVVGIHQPTEFSIVGALQYGVTQTYTVATMIFEVLGLIVTGEFSMDYIAGPIGIYDYTGQAAALGIFVLMNWSAALSVNLGIINLLPIPAMDGGRLVFLGLEALRGKPIDPQKEGMVHFIGFALLFLLVIVVTWNDINRLFM